ncbi:MAG: metal ABC transporter permease [Proteobacteria bacterium]|nr:metal ABC transporter permease [Pseudomonadota bacterium]MDA1332371.1 metal ABC transporter permease [Pseudomonadota bacterium]
MADLLNIITPALLIGLMVALVHTPLGIEVLKRGIIFIDLAIAQIAGLGYVVVETLNRTVYSQQAHVHSDPTGFALGPSLGALCFALMGGLIFRDIEKHFPKQQEAWIGVFFVLSASLSILVLTLNPHGDEELKHLLSGQILFASMRDVVLHLPFFMGILATWMFLPRVRQGIGFYLMFALTITASVQLVGIYVVFASLILPALVTVGKKRRLLWAWLFSASSILIGIALSAMLDAPTGPLLVTTYAVLGILGALTALLAPKASEAGTEQRL